jgi:AraC-like DNA-binding protein
MSVPLEIGSVLTLSCPIIGALFAFMMLLMDTGWKSKVIHRENHILMAYFLTTVVNLAQLISLHFNPEIYIWTSALGLLTYGSIQIFFYWFVFELTRMDSRETFSGWHFVTPVVFSAILLILLLIAKSIEPLVDLVNGKETVANRGYLLVYMGNVYGLKLLFGVAYVVFSCVRLVKYNRFIRNYSANEEKGSLRWLWFLIFISVVVLPFPLIWISMKGMMAYSLAAIVTYSLLLLFFYVYLTLHVIRRDRFRVILEPLKEESLKDESLKDESQKGESTKGESTISKKSVLKKALFEEYILKEKPFLNQDLRITDLVDVFHVNRTYISSFINVEYNMNFSSYINSHRMEEFRRLSKLPECKHKSKQELVEMAGFNSYRSFLRIKATAF